MSLQGKNLYAIVVISLLVVSFSALIELLAAPDNPEAITDQQIQSLSYGDLVQRMGNAQDQYEFQRYSIELERRRQLADNEIQQRLENSDRTQPLDVGQTISDIEQRHGIQMINESQLNELMNVSIDATKRAPPSVFGFGFRNPQGDSFRYEQADNLNRILQQDLRRRAERNDPSSAPLREQWYRRLVDQIQSEPRASGFSGLAGNAARTGLMRNLHQSIRSLNTRGVPLARIEDLMRRSNLTPGEGNGVNDPTLAEIQDGLFPILQELSENEALLRLQREGKIPQELIEEISGRSLSELQESVNAAQEAERNGNIAGIQEALTAARSPNHAGRTEIEAVQGDCEEEGESLAMRRVENLAEDLENIHDVIEGEGGTARRDTERENDSYRRGDFNLDGRVNETDVEMLERGLDLVREMKNRQQRYRSLSEQRGNEETVRDLEIAARSRWREAAPRSAFADVNRDWMFNEADVETMRTYTRRSNSREAQEQPLQIRLSVAHKMLMESRRERNFNPLDAPINAPETEEELRRHHVTPEEREALQRANTPKGAASEKK